MLTKVLVEAPCKINLSLDITGKREDGYHFVRMLMQSISLYDHLALKRTDTSRIILGCDHPHVPVDETNIAWKAADAFYRYTKLPCDGVEIDIKKRIPFAAGLGGGSADGAAVLVGLNRLYGTNLPVEELCQIGLEVGADIPFCIRGGTMLVEGIGEICTSLPDLPECYIVVAKPKEGVSTKEAFFRFDEQEFIHDMETDSIVAAVVSGQLEEICGHMRNVLQPVCNLPQVDQLAKKLVDLGAMQALMSGSGSAVFGIYPTKMRAKRAYKRLRGEAYNVFLTQPVNTGAQVVEEFFEETTEHE